MWINNKTIIQFNVEDEDDRRARDVLRESLINDGYKEEVSLSANYVQYEKDRLTAVRTNSERILYYAEDR